MKKTTLLRKTAYLVSPQIADGFVPPANFDYKISVSLHEVDIKIYGFTGTSWELMHDSDGVIASFETEVQHQKYYFESKSGQEQTVRVSFLSTEDAPGAGIRTGVTSETRRFYDIEEIPVYNGSRDGAMLTVMSDGSLAWLLVNESFTVPEEGGNAIAGTFLEDMPAVIARAPSAFSSGIYTDNGQGGGQGISVFLNDDDILEYDSITNETVNDEFTISWWMNLNSSQTAHNLGLAGMNMGQVNGVVRRFVFDLGNGSTLVNPHFMSYTRGPRTTMNLNTGVSMAGVWTHVAIVIKNDSSNTVASLYLNGNKLPNSISEPLGTKFFPPSSHQVFKFGAGFQSNSVKGQFDSMQIADGTALTDSQVAAIAGQADRQMSIETAAQAGATPTFTPSGVGTFLEELTMFGGGTLTDGVLTTSTANPSYYKKSGMPVVSTTATTAVFSMWFNPTQAKMGLYSDMHVASQVTFGLRMFNTELLHISTPLGTTNAVTLVTPLTLNEWHHALVTVETDVAYASTSSKSMTVKLFIDGQEVYTKTGNSSTKRIRAHAGISNSTMHHIGAQKYNTIVDYKGVGQFDFIEWVDDVTLSDAQILAMYNGGTRGWSVADGNSYTP
jgi:hypothetical protein